MVAGIKSDLEVGETDKFSQNLNSNELPELQRLAATAGIATREGNADHQDDSSNAMEEALKKSHELLLLGQFENASACLRPFDSESTPMLLHVAVLRAEARIWMSRGYVYKAMAILKQAQERLGQSADQPQLGLSMHILYVAVMSCSDDAVRLQKIEEAQKLLDELSPEHWDMNAVDMQSHIDRVVIYKQLLCQRRNEDCLPKIQQRLRPVINHLQQKGLFLGIWLLSFGYLRSMSAAEAIIWLKEFLQDVRISKCLFALFSLELAKRMLQNEEQADTWLFKAQHAFQEAGHMFGELEIRGLRLEYESKKSDHALEDLVDLLDKYIEADYPTNILQTAITLEQMVFHRQDFESYMQRQHLVAQTCDRTGLKLPGILLNVGLLIALNSGKGHHDIVVQMGRDLYRHCSQRKYWTVACWSGHLLAMALNERGENAEAIRIAEDVYKISCKEDLEVQSAIASGLAVIRKRYQQGPDRLEEQQQNIQFLLPLAEEDIDRGRFKDACEKLTIVSQVIFEIACANQDAFEDWNAGRREVISKIRGLIPMLQEKDRPAVEATCDESDLSQLIYQSYQRDDCELEFQGIDTCTHLIEVYNKQDMKHFAAGKYQLRAGFHQRISRKQADMETKRRELDAAMQDGQSAFMIISEMKLWLPAMRAHRQLTETHMLAWSLKWLSTESLTKSLLELESVADRRRQEFAVTGGLEALLQKQKYSAAMDLQNLYQWATRLSIETSSPGSLLLWSQKRKARSLSEVLGLGIVVPMAVQEALLSDPATAHIPDELASLKTAYQEANQHDRAYLMQKITECEEIAKKQSRFKNFVDLREGFVSGISELRALNIDSNSKRATIFADWVVYLDQIYLVTADTRDPETTCKIHLLDITVTTLKNWVTEYFDTPDKRRECLKHDDCSDDNSTMRALDPLVAPFNEASRAGDLLLLSPTAVVSNLPLHVLRVSAIEKIPLILRHPIVYVPSLPIARICSVRTREKRMDAMSLFFGVFESDGHGKIESERIYDQMDRLAKEAHGTSYCGPKANKKTYQSEVSSARLIHHHLHGELSTDNVLGQAIVLHDSEDSSEAVSSAQADQGGNESGHEHLLSGSGSASRLTVEEIFDLKLASPLVVLIACDSAAQVVQESDEPLGLITGFLCAGAASIIGAIWRVPSKAGRTFSDALYNMMQEPKGVVDLALALQEAVLVVRDQPETSSTYYWGAFCLYGAWEFHPPWQELSEDVTS